MNPEYIEHCCKLKNVLYAQRGLLKRHIEAFLTDSFIGVLSRLFKNYCKFNLDVASNCMDDGWKTLHIIVI